MTEPMSWRNDGHDLARQRAVAAGLNLEQADSVIAALATGGFLVSTSHAEPTTADLVGDYAALGYAYLSGRIKARWVMCAETHDVLRRRYTATRYAAPYDRPPFAAAVVEPSVEVVAHEVRTVMERKHWTDPGKLFGLPIRLDPAARRPMFELEHAAEPPGHSFG